MTYTDENRTIPQFYFYEDSVREAWRRRVDDIKAMGEGAAARIIAAEKNGLLAYRATEKSMTLVARFYSATHRETLCRKILKISSEKEITDDLLTTARERAAALKRKADGAADYDPDAAKTQKKYALTPFRELADIYFTESDHFAGLRLQQQKNRKGSIEKIFLDFSPEENGVTFGDMRRGNKSFFFSKSQLKAWRRAKLKKYTAKKPFQFNRCRSYTRVMMKWLADNDYMPHEAIIDVDALPEKAKVKVRRVSLGDDMLRALWNATEQLPAFERGFMRVLILTGQRLSIIGALRWSEVRLDSNIPQLRIGANDPERAKNDEPYALPITGYIADIIREQRRIEGSEYVFSCTGKHPITNYTKIKNTLDKAMKAELGDAFYPWRNHDLRRTVVDKISGAGVPSMVRELVIAHSPSWDNESQKHYDVSSYILEKQDAMEKLHEAIMRAVNPSEFREADSKKARLVKKLESMSAEKLEAIAALLG